MKKTLEKLCAKFQRLMRCEGGQDLVEYGMLVTLIALVCISGMQGTANSINTMFGEVSQALAPQAQQAGQPTPSPAPDPAPHHHHHGGGGGGWGWWH
jgi:Flp pilus assembly pilin Flp